MQDTPDGLKEISLRDYFAAKAMKEHISGQGYLCTVESIAKRSYELANAMLKEAEKYNA